MVETCYLEEYVVQYRNIPLIACSVLNFKGNTRGRKKSLLNEVTTQESEDEYEGAQGREGHRVAGHADRPAARVEPPDAGTHKDAAHEADAGWNKMETIKWTCGRSNWSQLVIVGT